MTSKTTAPRIDAMKPAGWPSGIEAHELPDERCGKRAPNAQDRRKPEARGSGARRDRPCDQSGHETDQNGPNPMQHLNLPKD